MPCCPALCQCLRADAHTCPFSGLSSHLRALASLSEYGQGEFRALELLQNSPQHISSDCRACGYYVCLRCASLRGPLNASAGPGTSKNSGRFSHRLGLSRCLSRRSVARRAWLPLHILRQRFLHQRRRLFADCCTRARNVSRRRTALHSREPPELTSQAFAGYGHRERYSTRRSHTSRYTKSFHWEVPRHVSPACRRASRPRPIRVSALPAPAEASECVQLRVHARRFLPWHGSEL